MADVEIGAQRDALQAQLKATGLNSYDVQYGKEQLDCVLIFPKPPAGGQFEVTSGGRRKYSYVAEIHVALQGDEAMRRAQDRLDGYISPTGTKSVQKAIVDDQTLGGVVNLAVAYAFTSYGFSKLDDKKTLMARIPIEVTT